MLRFNSVTESEDSACWSVFGEVAYTARQLTLSSSPSSFQASCRARAKLHVSAIARRYLMPANCNKRSSRNSSAAGSGSLSSPTWRMKAIAWAIHRLLSARLSPGLSGRGRDRTKIDKGTICYGYLAWIGIIFTLRHHPQVGTSLIISTAAPFISRLRSGL